MSRPFQVFVNGVEQVIVSTPDKDLAQCVRDDRVVQLDRRSREIRNESGVQQKFGVAPESIPDWLALVGDSADGFPGLPGWGAKSAATVLARYRHLEDIPKQAAQWNVSMRGTERLAATLVEQWERASQVLAEARSLPEERDGPAAEQHGGAEGDGEQKEDQALLRCGESVVPASHDSRRLASVEATARPCQFLASSRCSRAEHCTRRSDTDEVRCVRP